MADNYSSFSNYITLVQMITLLAFGKEKTADDYERETSRSIREEIKTRERLLAQAWKAAVDTGLGNEFRAAYPAFNAPPKADANDIQRLRSVAAIRLFMMANQKLRNIRSAEVAKWDKAFDKILSAARKNHLQLLGTWWNTKNALHKPIEQPFLAGDRVCGAELDTIVPGYDHLADRQEPDPDGNSGSRFWVRAERKQFLEFLRTSKQLSALPDELPSVTPSSDKLREYGGSTSNLASRLPSDLPSEPTPNIVVTSGSPPGARRKRGRKPGQSVYAESDKVLVEEGIAMVTSEGISAHAAAKRLASRAEGNSEDAKVRRLGPRILARLD